MNDDITPLTPVTQVDELTTITELITNYLNRVDKDRDELKKLRQMFTDSFENDVVYRGHAEKAKEAIKVKNATKAQLLKQPAVAELREKIKSLSESVKEAVNSISDYLQEYQRLSGLNSFETPDGKVRQIVYTAKLVSVGEK